jgi:hypothetical protein
MNLRLRNGTARDVNVYNNLHILKRPMVMFTEVTIMYLNGNWNLSS